LIGQHAFGTRLRTQRERRGVSLAALADATKIKASLFDALERGDLSQWPKGLYRRSYLREYATAVGVPPEALLAEIDRLFPEDGEPKGAASHLELGEPMRLSFPTGSELATHRVTASVAGAALELAVVCALGVLIGAVTGLALSASCGLAALIYYPVATALTGRTLSSSRLRMLLGRLRKPAQPAHPAGAVATLPSAAEPATLNLVGKPSVVSSSVPTPLLSVTPGEDLGATRTAAS
jgi:transcriptional regulator with XRE-family HTH domain